MGRVSGEYPVYAYYGIFLEIAKENKREDLSGRFNFSGSNAGQTLYTNFWHPVRSIPLPLFETDPDLSFQELKEGYNQLLEEWYYSSIPDNIPSAAIALKTHGNYCDEREAQRINVLLVYPNSTARLMFLDFFEGGMDDCISPEWYLSSSQLMPVETAIQEITEIALKKPELQRVCSSLFVKPNFFGDILQGKRTENNDSEWGFEWIYNSHSDLTNDLSTLLDEFQSIFIK